MGVGIGKTLKRITVSAAALLMPVAAWATPSTTYWAPSVATCQGKAVPHITYDTYFAKSGAYPIDTGVEIGVLPGNKVQAELGYDLLTPGDDPTQLYINGKVCVPENSMGKGAPAISVGMMNIGFKKDVTDYDMFHVMVQKSLPFGGYIAGGFYHGFSDTLFVSSEGKKAQNGAIVGWASPDIKVDITGLSKILFIADVQTGKNAFGAGGAGINLYFNDYVGLITGPVFFFDKELQPAKMLWTLQIDVDIPLGKKKP